MSEKDAVISPLLQNAIDSIQLGFEDYFLMKEKSDERRILSSIRNLHAGVLLLLMAKIQDLTPQAANNALIIKSYQFKIVGDQVVVVGDEKSNTIDSFRIFEHLKVVGINIDEQKKRHERLAKVRNEIEHHFCGKPKEELENVILEFYWFVKEFNDKFYNLKNDLIFSKENLDRLIKIEAIDKKQRRECFEDWKKLPYDDIENRIPETQEEFNDQYIIEMLESELAHNDEYVDLYYNGIKFFSLITCPCCQSDLVKPVSNDFSNLSTFRAKCTRCGDQFFLKDIIEDHLQYFYQYEICKAGSKGGNLPLSRCIKCNLGTFINYNSTCFYCGNTEEGAVSPDFERELMSNNVNIFMFRKTES